MRLEASTRGRDGRDLSSSGQSAPGHEHSFAYRRQIDGLRTIAVLAVMAFHLDLAYCPGGFVGVDIFFVISGFVVTRSMADRPFASIRSQILFFYDRRLRRILPALIVMLLLASLATVAFVPDAWLGRSNRATAVSAFFGVSNILLATKGEDYFDAAADYNPFLHTWSLGVEEQFYLLFPFILAICQATDRRGRRPFGLAALAAVAAGSLAWCAYATRQAPASAYFQMPGRFWELGLGVFIALTRDDWARWLAGQKIVLLRVGAGVFAVLIVLSLVLADAKAFPFPWAIPPVLGTAGLLMLADARGAALDWLGLGTRPMAWIGRRSYSLYLYHWPIYALFRWTTGLDGIGAQGAAVALTAVLSFLSYRWVEQPVRRSARLSRARKPLVVGSFIASTAIGASLSTLVFALAPILSLSVTRDARTWSPFSRNFAPSRCAVRSSETRGAGVVRVAMWPVDCRAGPPARRLWVIGDSHAVAYTAMLGRLTAEEGITVEIRSTAGCAVLGFRRPEDDACAGPTARVLAELLDDVRPGDLVFLPSLRIDRFVNLIQDAEIHEGNADADPASIAAALAYLRRLTAQGAIILLEAPLPVFRAPAFRCADWFNRANAVCRPGLAVSRAEIERRRASILAAETTVSASLPGVTVWDPLPSVCDKATCSAVDGGKPLFFDSDHLSGYGNQRLYPAFAAEIRRLIGKPAAP